MTEHTVDSLLAIVGLQRAVMCDLIDKVADLHRKLMAIEAEHIGPQDIPHERARQIQDHIDAGHVIKQARDAIRRSLDRADAPVVGRPAHDAAVGRIARENGRGRAPPVTQPPIRAGT
jgi:hypothetical protein